MGLLTLGRSSGVRWPRTRRNWASPPRFAVRPRHHIGSVSPQDDSHSANAPACFRSYGVWRRRMAAARANASATAHHHRLGLVVLRIRLLERFDLGEVVVH